MRGSWSAVGSRRPTAAELQRVLGQGLPEPDDAARAVMLGEEPAPKKGRKDSANQSRLGHHFEARLESQHRFYEHNKIATVEKQYPPVKWIGGKATVVGRATVDFMGAMADLRGVAFEAKNPSRGFIDLLDPDEVEHHQVDFLRRWRGLGFWLICFGEGWRDDAVLVPAPGVVGAIDAGRKAGAKSVRWREADAIAAGGMTCRGVDWAAALRAAEEAAQR